MKLADVIILSLSVALLIIGIHQTMTSGIIDSYWILMLSTALLLFFKFRKKAKA